MTQVTIEIDKVPEGYKVIAFRQVKNGEWYAGLSGRVYRWDMPDTTVDQYLILKPVLRLQSGKFYVDEDGKVAGVKWSSQREVYVGDDGRREFYAFGGPATSHKPLVREATKIEALRHLAEIHGLGEIELGTVVLGQEFKVHVAIDGHSTDRSITFSKAMLTGVGPSDLTFRATAAPGLGSW